MKLMHISQAIELAGRLNSGEYIRWEEDPNLPPGTRLMPSREYSLENQLPTGKILAGTSVISPRRLFDQFERDADLSWMRSEILNTGYWGYPYVVKGKFLSVGIDPGEVIIGDAQVVRRIYQDDVR